MFRWLRGFASPSLRPFSFCLVLSRFLAFLLRCRWFLGFSCGCRHFVVVGRFVCSSFFVLCPWPFGFLSAAGFPLCLPASVVCFLLSFLSLSSFRLGYWRSVGFMVDGSPVSVRVVRLGSSSLFLCFFLLLGHLPCSVFWVGRRLSGRLPCLLCSFVWSLSLSFRSFLFFVGFFR